MKLFFKILFLLSLPVAFISFKFSKQILEIIYNRSDFLTASFILKIAAFIMLIRFCVHPFSIMLTINGNQWKKALVAFLAVIINILLNLIFIPKYGTSGAIIISLITNAFAGILYIIFTYPLFAKWAVDRRFAVSIIFMIIAGYLISVWNNIPVWIFAPMLIILFFTVSILINFTSEERSLLFYFKLKGIKYE